MEHTQARPPRSRGSHSSRYRSLCAQILRSFRPSFLCASAAQFIGMKPGGRHDIRLDGRSRRSIDLEAHPTASAIVDSAIGTPSRA